MTGYIFTVLTLCIAIIAFLGMGCLPSTNGDDDWDSAGGGGIGGTIMYDMLGNQDSLSGGHLMGDEASIKEPWMDAQSRAYLEEVCAQCHTLDRVFWSHGPRSMWESVLNQEQHKEIGLNHQEMQRLHTIFQRYLKQR